MPYSTEAIRTARDLRTFLGNRGRLRSNTSALRLDAGEVEHTVVPVNLWQYVAGDPTYHRPGIYGPPGQQLIFGALHDRAERKAREDAQPRWRVVDSGDLHVTNRRCLLRSRTRPPTSWWLGSVLVVELSDLGVYVAWDGVAATFGAGDASPYLYVLVHYLAYDGLPQI